MAKKPNKKERHWFWKQCGFTEKGEVFGKPLIYYKDEPVSYGLYLYPPLTIDSLVTYAVPVLRDLSEDNTLKDIEFHWQGVNITDMVECDVILDNAEYSAVDPKDPSLALFWALYQAFEDNKEVNHEEDSRSTAISL